MARQIQYIFEFTEEIILDECPFVQTKEITEQESNSSRLPCVQHNYKQKHDKPEQSYKLQEFLEECDELFTKCQNKIHSLDAKVQGLKCNIHSRLLI